MNKKGKIIKYLSVFLVMVLLTYSIYIFMPDKVKLVVGTTNSKFYVWEDDSWTLSATEYVKLFDGTKKMRASSRDVQSATNGDITTIVRTSYWKDNIKTIDTYIFDSTVTDEKLFPISHDVEVINAVGKIVHFEYRDILYTGETRLATSPERFGHKMVVEWQDGAYYAKIFQQKVASDKLIIRYRPTSDYEVYSVRMFDPIPFTQISYIKSNTTNLCYQNIVDNSNTLEGWCNVTDGDGDNISYEYIWYKDDSLFSNGNASINVTQGVERNLNNISIVNISIGNNWIFSCRGYDGINYSNWLNSTEIKIHNISFLIDDTIINTLSDPITKELGSVILNASIDAYNRNVSSVSAMGSSISCDADNDKIFSAENGIRYIFNFSIATDGTATYDGSFLTLSGAECPSNAVDYYYDATNTKHYFICANYDIYTYDATGAYITNYDPTNDYRSISGNGTNLFLSDVSSLKVFVTNLSAENAVALPETNGLCDRVTYAANDDTLWCEDLLTDRLSHFYTNGTRINFEVADIAGESIVVCGDMNYLYSNDGSNIYWYDISDNYVCIDDAHTDFGTNYSCDLVSTQFDAKISKFHIRQNSDSQTTFTLNYSGAENKSFKIQGHQYDDFNNLTFNVSGVGDNVKIYVGTTLSNTLGLMSESGTYNQTKFNDTSDAKNVTISTNGTLGIMGYFRIPKTATITSINMTITGIDNVTFPFDPWIEIGILDGTYEWNYTGNFTGNNRDGNWSTAITTFLATCTADSDGFCYVPLYGYSLYKGRLQASVISIIYTYTINPITVGKTLIQTVLTAGSGYTNVTIMIENSETGNITISDIDYDYLGGLSSGDIIKAHSSDGFCNIRSTLRYSYSGWGYTLPPNINYLNWYPWAKDAQNVTPFGQTNVYSMVNVTTTNYGSNLDFSIKMYGSSDCVTLTVDTDNAKAGGTTMVNNTFITLKSDISDGTNFGIWLWADLSCSYADWRIWNPTFEFKAEATV